MALRLAQLGARTSLAASRTINSRRSSVACMASAAGPKYHLLQYSFVPDILEKRGPHREGHLAGAKAQLDAGKLVCAGEVADLPEDALFVFKDASKEAIEAFVAADPYVEAGLVSARRLRHQWKP